MLDWERTLNDADGHAVILACIDVPMGVFIGTKTVSPALIV
jgi:hypothetical protein